MGAEFLSATILTQKKPEINYFTNLISFSLKFLDDSNKRNSEKGVFPFR